MLKVGIVGLPNVGKSTLFTALTKKQVDCANFPFCTIEPNVGVVEVPDHRIDELARVSGSKKTIPTAIEFVDIAGLVKGAHAGEGLGNKFLANIRETDLIAHVVRQFEDGDITHVEGSVDPVRDAELIELELSMADLASVEKRLEGVRKKSKSGDKDAAKEQRILEVVQSTLSEGKLASEAEIQDDDQAVFHAMQLLTSKPIVYIVNVSEEMIKSGKWTSPFTDGRIAIPISVQIEAELASFSKEEAVEFLQEFGLNESGLDQVIRTCYEKLNLITYFTSGEQETRAWTITKGTKAPRAAGKIHGDFERGFIRSETVSWDAFVECGGWPGAREAGKLRVEGKEYVMQDGDVCLFRFNV